MADSKPSSILQHPAQLLEMAQRLIADSQGQRAITLANNAIQGDDGSGLLAAIGRNILSQGIPGFHWPMLRDHARNSVYANAIAALAPGRTVLDIGTGSGLLAMLAARAGAKHVYACEADQRLAATAKDIIAANGLADRITLFPVHSGKLDRDVDLGGGADLVVSEIFSDDLLGESVLPSLEDARKRLCLPGALFLPSKGAIRVALAGYAPSANPARLGPISNVEGCDLSLLNRHLPKRKRFSVNSGELEIRSDAANLFAFDFSKNAPASDMITLELESKGGVVNGVAQWIWFEAAKGHEFENRLAAETSSHWLLLYHAFDNPISTEPGQVISVSAWRNEKTFLIWNNGLPVG